VDIQSSKRMKNDVRLIQIVLQNQAFVKHLKRQWLIAHLGRSLSFSHEGPQFKSRPGHLFISLLICDLIDC
jgi:hypothetical protein